MDRKVAMDFIVGLVSVLFLGLFLVTTSFSIYFLIENVVLMQFLQTTHYTLAIVGTILFSMLIVYGIGRLANKLLESKGISVY